MTLNGHTAHCCTDYASFRAHLGNLKEPTDSTFRQYKVYVDIRRGSVERGHQTKMWLSTTATL